MSKIKTDIYNLKNIVSKFVDEPYRPAMNLLAINSYKNYHSLLKGQQDEQPENYNPFELTLDKIIFECNSRFRK